MSDVLEAKGELRRIVRELDERSRLLAETSFQLRPVEAQYREFMRDHKLGLYRACEGQGKRMPSKETQEDLALAEMPNEFRGKHYELVEKRASLEQRIRDLKAQADAWRSILSAEKVELEALA